MLLDIYGRETHSDDNVHRAHERFPVGVNGHRSDLHHLPGQIVQFVCLNEGGEAFGVEAQLCRVGENLNAIHVTLDPQAVMVPVAGLALVDLQRNVCDSKSPKPLKTNRPKDSYSIW